MHKETAPNSAESWTIDASKADATKTETDVDVVKVDAAGDGESEMSKMISEDPVGEEVLDVTHVNSGIEQLELDDSLC